MSGPQVFFLMGVHRASPLGGALQVHLYFKPGTSFGQQIL